MDSTQKRKESGVGSFLACVLLHMGLPLTPIGAEYLVTGDVTPQSLSIAAVMYATTIGVSSRWRTMLALVITAIVLFAPLYGVALTHHDAPGAVIGGVYVNLQNADYTEKLVHRDLKTYSIELIAAVFVLHLVERFNRHVIRKEPFFSVSGGGISDV